MRRPSFRQLDLEPALKNRKSKLYRVTASFVLITFLTTQVSWGQEIPLPSPSELQPAKNIESEDASLPLTPACPAGRLPSPQRGEGEEVITSNTVDFLQGDVTLKPVEEKPQDDILNYEYERYEFEDALEQLRPEYASAVIVKGLTAENLKKLAEQPFETGILVLRGEIVLFTSGSEDEIGVLPAARELISKATFISHTHPSQHSKEGPSGQDLNEAVAAPSQEYVLTQKGIYAYNQEGILNDGNPFAYEWYVEKLEEALEASQAERNQVEARKELNLFIAEQDRYNSATEEEKETFRRGGTLSHTAGLTSASVTTLAGTPLPYLTAGSSAGTTLSYNATYGYFQFGYSVPNVGDYSGMRISFDNESTAGVETQNVSALTYLTFGLKGPNTAVELRITDINGVEDTFTLTNVINTGERFWRVPVASISNTLDKTKIKSLQFIVSQVNTTATTRAGTLYIRTKGLNTAAPTQPVITSAVPAATNQTTLTVTGTKEANTAILINNVQVLPLNNLTTWTATVNLTVEGNNTFSITTKNSIGKVSAATSVTIKKDTVVPTGSVNINSGAVYASSVNVTLNLSATDANSGIDKMSFSSDGLNWTTPELYAATKAFALPGGDGSKTVYVKYLDKAGNVSAIYSKFIILDITLPTGTININSGAIHATSAAVTLQLSAADAGSGMNKMSFSNDGLTWTAQENYAATKTYTLPTGDGNKTVYVKYFDKAGNAGVFSKSIILDTLVPTGTININAGAAFTNSPALTLNLSAADAGSGIDKMSFSTDNVNWTAAEAYATAKQLSVAGGNGARTVYVKYYDKVGRVSVVYSKSITLDTTPPTGTININSGAAYATTPAVTLNLSAADTGGSGIDKMSFSTDNLNWTAQEAYAASKSFTLPSGDGSKTVYVRYYDKVGNLGNIYSKSIVLDTLAPTGTIKVNGGVTAINNRIVTLNLSAADAGMGVNQMKFSSDNVTYTTAEVYAAAKAWTFSAGDGNKTVYVKFSDKTGKWSTAIPVTVLLDTVIPTGTLNSINNGASLTNNPQVTLNLTAQDAASGIETLSFSFDNLNWTAKEAYASTKLLTLPTGDGNKTVYVKIYDRAGNASAVSSKSIQLDTTAPSSTIVVNNNASYTTSIFVNLSLSAADGLSGVRDMSFAINSLDEAAFSPWESFITLKSITLPDFNGPNDINARIRDWAGNISWVSDSIILDTKAPAGTFALNNGASYTNNGIMTFDLNFTDELSGVTEFRYRRGSHEEWSAWASYTQSIPVDNWGADGTRWGGIQVRDLAGNITDVWDSIILDTVKPTGTFALNNGGQYTNSGVMTFDLNFIDDVSGVAELCYRRGSYEEWSAWTPYTQSITVDNWGADGTRWGGVQVRDLAGNITDVWDSIILDTVKPVGSVSLNNGEKYTTSLDMTISLASVSDEVSGLSQMRFSNDGGTSWSAWEAFANSKTITFPGGFGPKGMKAQIRDGAGNTAFFSDTIDYYPVVFELEAEAMQATTGGIAQDGHSWNLWSNGEVYDFRNVEAGIYDIEIVAMGQDAAGVLALMQARIDNRSLGDPVSVANNNWSFLSYAFRGVELEEGAHEFAAAFLNDFSGGSWETDRNLYIDKIIIKKVGELPPSTARFSLKATQMQTEGGTWNGGTYVSVWGNGKVYQDYDVKESGVYQIEIAANGMVGSGALPFLRATVDNRVVGNPVQVDNNYWAFKTFVFQSIELEAGSHKFAAGILNGLNGQSLGIQQIVVRKIGELPPPTDWFSLKATQMQTEGGAWNGGTYISVWGNGKVLQDYDVKQSGIYEIEVVASGVEGSGKLPLLRATFDNRQVGDPVEATNNTWAYKSYVFRSIELEAGFHNFSAGILGGLAGQSLGIQQIIVRKTGELAPPQRRIVLEAEQMQKTTGGPTENGQGWVIWANGEIFDTKEIFESGVYQMEVVALGQAAENILPLMDVKIDDQRVAENISVANHDWSYKTYVVPNLRIDAGYHKFAAAFINDYFGGSWETDRNLSVDKIIIRKVGELLPAGFAAVLNNSAHATNNRQVTLTLTSPGGASGPFEMSYAIGRGLDQDYSAWEPLGSKTLILPDIQGSQQVFVRLRDGNGNMAWSSDSIILDNAAPAGSLAINGNAIETSSRNVSLDITAADALSGLDQMRFSTDLGVNWTSWEAFTPGKSFTLAEGDGLKEVWVEVNDKAGNTGLFKDSIRLASVASEIAFTSASSTNNSNYTLTYTVNGEARSESWKLVPGENQLLVRASVNNGASSYAQWTVTLNQTEPGLPPMPAIPTLPSDLVSLTTADGPILKYQGDNLVSIEKPGEYQLYLPELDQAGNLVGGLLVFASGDKLLYQNSKPVYQLSVKGEKTIFNADGTAASYENAQGQKIRFAYQFDLQGKISAVLALENTVTSLYEGEFPVWVIKDDGTDIRYRDGFLSEYKDAAGNQFFYQTKEVLTNAILTGFISDLISIVPSGTFASVPVSAILSQLNLYPAIKNTLENDLAVKIEYTVDKQMKLVTSGKNEVLELQNKLPISLKSSAGATTLFENSLDANGNLQSISADDGTPTQIFDAEGKLVSIRLSDGSVLEIKELKVDEIALDDGSVLTGLKWNGNNLTDFIRTRPDGSKEIYTNSRLVRREDIHGNATTYVQSGADNQPDQITTPDGRTYKFFDYQNALGLSERISELIKIDLPDGSRIEFENGKPVRYIRKKEIQLDPFEVPVLPQAQSYVPSIRLPNAELRSMTIDAEANILSGEILFNDGTQYLIKDGELYKEITPYGKVIEFDLENEPSAFVPPLPIQPEPLTPAELSYRNQLVEAQLDYFVNGVGLHAETGLPLDNYRSDTGLASDYSQATLAGFWAEILATVAKGDYTTSRMSQTQALEKLSSLLTTVREVQVQAGWHGMISFFTIVREERDILDAFGVPTGQKQIVISYRRSFDNVGMGDNLNLSLSVATVIGAISNISGLAPSLEAYRTQILNKANEILAAQDAGYGLFYDSVSKRFRMAYQFNPDGSGTFMGYMDRVFNEFRSGLVWLAARNPNYKPALDNLDVTLRPYTAQDGTHFDLAVPFDGGAFQMFWPLIHVDETKYAEFDVALKNFLYAQADYVKQNQIPGLLSAGDDPGNGYNGKMGLPQAAEADDPLTTNVGSIYGTASAFALAPHYALQFLKNIETRYPQIRTPAGFVDAIKMQEVIQINPVTGAQTVVKQPVFSSQYYGVDPASYILSLLKTSQIYFDNYLAQSGLAQGFDSLYRSLSFGLNPAARPNAPPPDLGSPVSSLYEGTNPSPDGYSHPLFKQPAFITTLLDPDYGEGKIYNYLTPDAKYHHSEIEFGSGDSLLSMNLQEYLLLPRRHDAALSILEGFELDILNKAYSQGAFYTPGYGHANEALVRDPRVGEAHHITFDYKEVTKPVGIWALYSSLDLSRYDYVAVPVRLGPNTPEGVGLKFELKGLGEIFVTGPLTHEWQFFQIPVAKPAPPIKEIAVVIQSADGSPVKGDLYVGPMSAFKVRTSRQMDWQTSLGKTDAEIRNLLIQNVLNQPGGGGRVLADEVLENFTLDSDGKLIDGILKLADGGTQYFHRGRLTKWVFRNGRTILFEDGLASFVIDLARGRLEEGRFYYDKSFRGKIFSFVVQDNDRKRIFNGNGELQTMVDGGNTVHFKDGKIDSIVTPEATLTQLEFADDQGLLRAHVTMLDGSVFDIDQTATQFVDVGGGVKVYYQGQYISAIETPQNGRTDFTYQFDAAARLIGVNAAFNESITDPVTGVITTTARTMSLASYLQRPERSLEKGQILREPPVDIISMSGIGGFSVGYLPAGEQTWAGRSNAGYDSKAWYQFKYNSVDGTMMGMYASHTASPVDLTKYQFLNITLMQDPGMNWNQDFYLKVKSPYYATLYNFELDDASTQYQTFTFPMAGKAGSEGEVTLEVIRESGGVGKTGKVYIKDISYMAVKTLENPLWEDRLSVDAKEIQSLKIQSNMLTSVGKEIATDDRLLFSELVPYLDLPTWVVYSEKDTSSQGEVVSFKRFDGSEVKLNGQNISRMILPDGTVNEYSTQGSSAQGVIRGPDVEQESEDTMQYQYGALRQVTQSDGRVYTLTYEFDTDGSEITVIKDSVSGDERRFKNGKLLSSLTANQLKTDYLYEEGKLIGAQLLYKNKVLNSTKYHFAGEVTEVTDEKGTTWFYDANGNLIKHLTRDGFLYSYSDFTMELLSGSAFDPNDFKTKILTAKDLRAVNFLGYEPEEGFQITLDEQGLGVIRLGTGEQAVNLDFDGERRIQSGQIQFNDGLIIEIENYIPVRGRLQDGTVFTIAYPAAEATEILQSQNGEYLGVRFAINSLFFTYDPLGRLVKVESEDGRADDFTYSQNAQGEVTSYMHHRKTQLAFNGVPYPREIELDAGGNQKILDDGKEVAEHENDGFIVGVYKEAVNHWDVYSGTFASDADRLGLEYFLKEIKAGDYVSVVVNDPAFSNANETVLSIFEGLGSGRVREASSGNKRWTFFGNESLSAGQGYENVGASSFSTVTHTYATVNIQPGENPLFENQPVLVTVPPGVNEAFSNFLRVYEPHKPSADMQAVTVYDGKGEIVYSRRLDGLTSYYEFGKVRETYNAGGELLYVHEYACPAAGCQSGDDMKLVKTTLVKARLDFESEVRRQRELIEQTKFDALYRLSWQDDVARVRIREEVQSGLTAIDQQITDLEGQRFREVKVCRPMFCGVHCERHVVEVPGVQNAINTLRDQRSEFLRVQERELGKIAGAVEDKRLEIEDQTAQKLAGLDQQERETFFDILTREMEPILIDHYRRILGRDPSTQEVKQWVTQYENAQRIDMTVLESTLVNSSEKAQRESEKAAITAGVRTFLEAYLAGTPEEKQTLLATLGLNSSEVVALDSGDVTKILQYLESRDLHFGQSAFLSLKEMLASYNIQVPMEVIGKEAVLMDILAGVIHPFTEGDLLLSVFALTRVAQIHGAAFSGVRYSYQDLLNLYAARCPDPSAPCGLRVIAHIGEDHFVVITKVTQNEVTYLETSKGASGEEIKVNSGKFLEVWDSGSGEGYLIVSTQDAVAAKALTAGEMQKVRGAFFGLDWIFWLFVASIVLSAASIVVSYFSPTLGKILGFAAMVAGIVAIVGSLAGFVVNGVKAIFTNITQTASSFFQSMKQGFTALGKLLLAPVKAVGNFIMKGYQFLKTGFTSGFGNLGNGISHLKNFLLNPAIGSTATQSAKFSLGQQIARSLIAAGINMGVSKGLEGLGLDPTLSRLAGAFLGAGFLGIGAAGSSFFKSGLQGFMLQGVSEMGLKLGLPPPVTAALSLVTGAALTAYFSPTLTLSNTLTDIAPQVAEKLALGGLDLITRSLGLDPRIAALIGVPLGAVVGGFVGGVIDAGGSFDSSIIFNSIKNALLSKETLGGIVSVGAGIGLDAIGAPAVLKDFLPGILSQLIASGSGSTGGSGPPGGELTEEGASLFDKISDTFSKFGGGLVSAIGSVVGNVISFGQKVLEDVGAITKAGFGKAVDFFSNAFSRQTIEKLIRIGGGTIKSAFEQFSTITANGVEFLKDGLSIVWNAATDTFSYVDGVLRGTFDKLSIDSIGKLSSGAIEIGREIIDGVFLGQDIVNGNQNIHLKDGQGNSLFRIIGQAGKAIFDASGGILNGIVEGINGFISVVIEGGKVVGSTIKQGATAAWDALSNFAKSVGGGFQKAVEFVDQALFNIFVGSRDHDKWGQADIESNLGIRLDESDPNVYKVTELIDPQNPTVPPNPQMFQEIMDKLSYDPNRQIEFQASLTEMARVMNAHPNGAPLLIYVGDATGINNHIVNRELTSSISFVRDIFTFNGDHLPTEVDGVKLFLHDSSDNVLKNVLGQEIHNVRIGDGWHFHNISSGFAFFHHDTSAPNTSFGGMILHGLEFTSSIASGVTKTISDLFNGSGDES